MNIMGSVVSSLEENKNLYLLKKRDAQRSLFPKGNHITSGLF
jgi:hypothetical protein